LGAHFTKKGKNTECVFRVWAPRAVAVSLVGEFNGWDENATPMERMVDGETFEVYVSGVKVFDAYKFCITTTDGRKLFKADPYAFHSETPGINSSNSSKVYDLSGYKWNDKEFLDKQKLKNVYESPVNIYEVNLMSWKKHDDGSYYTYRELAKELVDYVKKMNYTHVEFMPVMEHPFDGSWGYQVTGYYSITSRLGTPHDFMYLVDCFHRAGIAVILDWVPAHFPKDAFGLYEFDGAPLYEPEQLDRRENEGWGTRKFDYYRAEVLSFLISNAIFYFEQFHVDGLRVDAVASMLYLDYDKKPGEWTPNIYGDNKNLEAVAFMRRLNEVVFSYYPHALMIAEESTAWPMITKPTASGGLGFNFKWNMGWMNDVLSYVATDPLFRRHQHNKLTFSMMYAFSENYVLPISHDEVVHGKASLIGKMPGSYEEKFAGVRVFLGYMMSHPGKKLNFMSSEFGQFKEWAYKEGVEFFLKNYPLHAKLSEFVKELNGVYRALPAFYEIENSWDGFEWLEANDCDANFIAYQRTDKRGNKILALINFSGRDHIGYRLGVEKGKYQLILNSDSTRFGGSGMLKKRVYTAERKYSHSKEYSIAFDIPKLTCLYFIKTI
jgi:1,4-alpha-glucan branching enzyme